MEPTSISRRNFIGKAAITAGLAALGTNNVFGKPDKSQASQTQLPQTRLPREVWIATVSQEGMSAETPEKMVQSIFTVLEKGIIYRPDVICLPEVFMYSYIHSGMSLQKEAALSDELLKEFMTFARTNNCYMICPVITHENGKIYNAAVVIDRQGNRMGEYRKTHLPDDEVALGLSPGPLQPPVFKADFGVFVIQICYDIHWD